VSRTIPFELRLSAKDVKYLRNNSKGKFYLLALNISIVVLAIAVVSGSLYSLITGEYGIQPYMQLLSGLMIFTLGLKLFLENRKNRKAIAIICLLASVFIFIFSFLVGIYVLLN